MTRGISLRANRGSRHSKARLIFSFWRVATLTVIFEMSDAQALKDVCSHYSGVAILSSKDRNNSLDSTCDLYSAFNIFKREANSVIYASNIMSNHTLITCLERVTAFKKSFDSGVASWMAKACQRCTMIQIIYLGVRDRYPITIETTLPLGGCIRISRQFPEIPASYFMHFQLLKTQTAFFLYCKITNGNGPWFLSRHPDCSDLTTPGQTPPLEPYPPGTRAAGLHRNCRQFARVSVQSCRKFSS